MTLLDTSGVADRAQHEKLLASIRESFPTSRNSPASPR